MDFEGPEVKIRNLQNVIVSSTKKLIESKAKEPWRPAKSGGRFETMTVPSKSNKNTSRKKDITEKDLDQLSFASFFEDSNLNN